MIKKNIKSWVMSPLGVVLLYFLAGFVAYGLILNAPFKTVDDYTSIINNPSVHSFAGLKTVFTESFFGAGAYYRPFVYVSFMLEYHAFGLNPFYYYLNNILLHVGCALLVFLIVGRLVSEKDFVSAEEDGLAAKKRMSGRNWRLAFFSGLLFCIHPVQWEAVTNVPGRSIVLCALFFLLGFYAFIRVAGEERFKAGWGVVLFGSFILSLLTKESAMMFPFVCLGFVAYSRREQARMNFSTMLFTVNALFLTLAVYILLRRALGITAVFQAYALSDRALGVLTFAKAALRYLGQLVLPVNFYFDYSERLFTHFRDPILLGAVAIWTALLSILFICRNKISRLAWFSLLWVIVNLATVAQVIPIRISGLDISAADHFLYLPMLGVSVLMVLCGRGAAQWLAEKNIVGSNLIRIAGASYIIFLLLTTVQQTIYSSRQIDLFERTVDRNPENTRIRNSLATAYGLKGRLADAEKHYRKVLDLDPFDYRARIGLGKTLADKGLYWDAIQEYNKVVNRGNMEGLWQNNRKVAYQALTRRYENMLEKEPRNADIYYSLGVLAAQQEDAQTARAHYEKAIALNPRHSRALFNLAGICEAFGKNQKALDYYRRALDNAGKDDDFVSFAQERVKILAPEASGPVENPI